MAFKMKGSPHKMGGIKGTSGHVSALKQHAEASALKASALKEGETGWWDKVKSAGKAVWDNIGEVRDEHGNNMVNDVMDSYGEHKSKYRKAEKESSNKMKSPMEQKKKLNLETIKEGFKGTDTEKVVKAVKNVAGKVKKFKKSLKPTSETTVSEKSKITDRPKYRSGGKVKRVSGETTVTATTEKNKKKLFGGNKRTTSSSSKTYPTNTFSDVEDNFKEESVERGVGGDRKRGTTTTTHTRNKRGGGGKKKEVTIDQNTGKKTVTRYKKDGSVKSTKVKKGDYSTYSTPSNKRALREENKGK